MNCQVLDALKIEKAFVLGTSQGGWVAVRMALLRPEMVSWVLWDDIVCVKVVALIDCNRRLKGSFLLVPRWTARASALGH